MDLFLYQVTLLRLPVAQAAFVLAAIMARYSGVDRRLAASDLLARDSDVPKIAKSFSDFTGSTHLLWAAPDILLRQSSDAKAIRRLSPAVGSAQFALIASDFFF
jgi:hypothetical protein